MVRLGPDCCSANHKPGGRRSTRAAAPKQFQSPANVKFAQRSSSWWEAALKPHSSSRFQEDRNLYCSECISSVKLGGNWPVGSEITKRQRKEFKSACHRIAQCSW